MIRALTLAAALLAAAAAPALASGVPPLGLQRGGGSAGLGYAIVGPVAVADVALDDGLTLGVLGAAGLLFGASESALAVRATRTLWTGGGHAVGAYLGAGFNPQTSQGQLPAYIQPGDLPQTQYVALGAAYESPPLLWGARFRGVLAPAYVRSGGSASINGVDTFYRYQAIGLQLTPELVLPIGDRLEVALLGAGLVSVYGRW